jgi:hypothetical protein
VVDQAENANARVDILADIIDTRLRPDFVRRKALEKGVSRD